MEFACCICACMLWFPPTVQKASKFTGNSKLISDLNVVVWRVSPGDRPASCPEFSPNLHLSVRGNIPKFLQAWTRWEEMEKSHLLSACLRSCYTCACFHCLIADLGLSTFCELWNVSWTDLWITRACSGIQTPVHRPTPIFSHIFNPCTRLHTHAKPYFVSHFAEVMDRQKSLQLLLLPTNSRRTHNCHEHPTLPTTTVSFHFF